MLLDPPMVHYHQLSSARYDGSTAPQFLEFSCLEVRLGVPLFATIGISCIPTAWPL